MKCVVCKTGLSEAKVQGSPPKLVFRYCRRCGIMYHPEIEPREPR